MIDRKTYLTLPGDYKTLKSDFLGALEASGIYQGGVHSVNDRVPRGLYPGGY